MKDDFLEKGTAAIKGIKLSSAEKGAVYSRLMKYADEHSPARAPHISPFPIAFRIFGQSFHSHYRIAIAGVLMMVLGGGGAAFAAEGSLPGDLLYPVKLNVTEPILGALAVGDVNKARWEAEKTVRRLDEAAALAVQGRLDQKTAETIKSSVDRSTSAFNSITESAGAQASSTDMRAARADFETSMNEHSDIISAVENRAANTGHDDQPSSGGAKVERARETKSGSGNSEPGALHNSTELPTHEPKEDERSSLLESMVPPVRAFVEDGGSVKQVAAATTSTATSTQPTLPPSGEEKDKQKQPQQKSDSGTASSGGSHSGEDSGNKPADTRQ